MRALTHLLIENKASMIAAAAVAFFVAALLVLLVFRLAFGHRLRMPGGRARQMRLGIVDAFDLDRQRQLVIVRRDNVEHLVMIGGPNDILIESQIVRTEAREMRGREKESREREATHAAAPVKPPVIEPKLPIPPGMPEPQPVAAAEEYAGYAPVALPGIAPISPVGRPATAAPTAHRPRPSEALAPAVKPLPTHEEAGEAEFAAKPQMRQPPPGKPQPPQQPPALMRWPARAPTPPAPPQPKRVAPSPQMPPARPLATPERPAAGPPVPSLEGLESLEEEMAKLLGRGPTKP